MTRVAMVLFVIWLALSSGAAAAADDERALRAEIAGGVERAWQLDDFAALDGMAEDFSRNRTKTFSGKWRLDVYGQALSKQINVEWPNEWNRLANASCRCFVPDPRHYEDAAKRWDTVRAKLESWQAKSPRSDQAWLALAAYDINRASFYRGGGYGSSVLEEAWPLFGKYMDDARAVLTAHHDIARRNPLWFQEMLIVERGRPADGEIARTVDELLRDGQSYTPAYQQVGVSLLPRWGGSNEMLERFARKAAKVNEEGAGAYARIYWVLQEDQNLFQQTGANWPLMKRGLEQIARRYPDPLNLNAEALFACEAGDAATYRALVRKLGDDMDHANPYLRRFHCEALL